MASVGRILVSSDDLAMVRDALGSTPAELPDDLIEEVDFLQAAEIFVMSRIPNWALILQLQAPATPVATAVANASSTLPAANYYVLLVSKVGATQSPAGGETTAVAVAAGQALQIPIPNLPGVTGYDVYVGVFQSQEFLQQTNVLPNQPTFQLTTFSMSGAPVAMLGNDILALKSATVSATCAHICKRLVRRVPSETRTLSYMEKLGGNRTGMDWREEQRKHMSDCSYYLGLISTYVITPPPALSIAHPAAGPNEPGFISGAGSPDATNPPGSSSNFPISR